MKMDNWLKNIVKTYHARTYGTLLVGDDKDLCDIDYDEARQLVKQGLIIRVGKEVGVHSDNRPDKIPAVYEFTPEGLALIDRHRPQK